MRELTWERRALANLTCPFCDSPVSVDRDEQSAGCGSIQCTGCIASWDGDDGACYAVPKDARLPVGTVLRRLDPEPPEGTPLLDGNGHVEPYERDAVGGRWLRYVSAMGPFVVAPNFDALTR